jgi:hypothetical protein
VNRRRIWLEEAGLEGTEPKWDRNCGEREISWRPSFQPFGSRDTTDGRGDSEEAREIVEDGDGSVIDEPTEEEYDENIAWQII